MILKTRKEVAVYLKTIDQTTISKLKKDFMKQIKENPDDEYEHKYFHQMFSDAFGKKNIKNTVYKSLFVLMATGCIISFILKTPLTYYLFFTSIIFAAQFD